MASSVKIEVRLGPEGNTLLGGINWAVLDLEPDFSPRLFKDVQQLSDINEVLTEGLLAFSVPFSTVNDAAFLRYSSPIITNNTDEGIEARLSVDASELPFDRIFFVEKNDSDSRWEVQFRRSPNHWLELSSNKKLCTIDVGSKEVNAALATEWVNQLYIDEGDPTRWFPVDYGGWVDQSEPVQFTDPPVKNIYLEDLRPWIYEVYLLKQGFCEIGWTLEGLVFESNWARAQMCYILSREYFAQSKGGLHKIIGQNLVGIGTGGLGAPPIIFDALQYDPGGNGVPVGPFWAGAILNSLPYKAKYKFTFEGYLKNNAGSGKSIKLFISDFDFATGLPAGQIYWQEEYQFTANETRYILVSQEIDLASGERGSFLFGAQAHISFLKGFRIIIEPSTKSLIRGDIVQINRLINCDYDLLSLFKGFVHKCNGRIETDFVNRVISVHPQRTSDVLGTTVPGFIQDGEVPVSLGEKIICSSFKMSPIKNDLVRYARYGFAQSTDAYIDSLQLPEPPFSRRVLNGLELKDAVQEWTNPFFEPTLEARNDELRKVSTISSPFLPRLYDNMDSERSFEIGPRSMFYFGSVVQVDNTDTNFLNGVPNALYFEGALTTEFGYASHLPTSDFDVQPTLNGTLVYGNEASDIYVMFYLKSSLSQKRGMWIDALVMMNQTDWDEWNFRVPFEFSYNGDPVLAFGQNIKDFAPALEFPTPMRLLVEPSDTSCCDQPCSCRFRECNYYQDFGQYITQDTLDALSITSFKVNEIEQLNAPVDFGVINVVQIAGRQFVRNLVDALNTIEVPYFFFAPSTKDYVGKSDLRFFKIKSPSCYAFEIIISDADGEVYRYRDFDMAQKWFNADWEAMGYAANPVSDPQDCVYTTEY